MVVPSRVNISIPASIIPSSSLRASLLRSSEKVGGATRVARALMHATSKWAGHLCLATPINWRILEFHAYSTVLYSYQVEHCNAGKYYVVCDE